MSLDGNVSPEGKAALHRLFKRAECKSCHGRSVTLPFFGRGYDVYCSTRDAVTVNEMHAYLENAKFKGAISIEWKQHYEGIQIERIRVLDLQILAKYLGENTLTARVEVAKNIVAPVLADAPDGLTVAVDSIFTAWLNGKKPLRLSPDDGQTLANVIRIIGHLDHEGSKGLDMRSLSVRLFNDTKEIESIIGPIVRMYRMWKEVDDQNSDEILADLELEKYPLPMLMKGPVEISLIGGETLCPQSGPYLGIPPDHIDRLVALSEAKYLLTIENLSSFNTFVRGGTGSGIILFTHGFPGRHFQANFQGLIDCLSNDFPIYHWGDIDVGGFRILAKLQQLADKVRGGYIIHPYLMDLSTLDQNIPNKGLLSDQEQRALRQIMPVNSMVDPLIEHILATDPRKVEQEAVPFDDISAPLPL